MKGFKVLIDHDRYSRKPININFKVSLVDREGFTLHSICFKEKDFDHGMCEAQKHKEFLEKPAVLFGFLAASISQNLGFKVDTSKGIEEFFNDVIKHSSTETLRHVLKTLKSENNQEIIKNELIERGEMNNEEAICIGSNGK